MSRSALPRLLRGTGQWISDRPSKHWFDRNTKRPRQRMRKEQEGDFNMQHTTPITIEHIVVESNQPYEKVVGALEARLGTVQDWAAIGQQAAAAHASLEQFTQEVEAHMATNGLAPWYWIDHNVLFSLSTNVSRP